MQAGVPEQAEGVPGAGPGAGELGGAACARHGRGKHPRPPASPRPRKLPPAHARPIQSLSLFSASLEILSYDVNSSVYVLFLVFAYINWLFDLVVIAKYLVCSALLNHAVLFRVILLNSLYNLQH